MAEPNSDHDWAIHSLNIHGTFFERLTAQIVEAVPGWQVDATNYPVEYPPSNAFVRGKDSNLDVRATHRAGDVRLCALIESKKNNPEFVNWQFFKKRAGHATLFNETKCQLITEGQLNWNCEINAVPITFNNLVVCDDGRETRGNYADYKKESAKTKTANDSIQSAAHQIALATQAVVTEDEKACNLLGSDGASKMLWRSKLYFPIIATTAKISICDFDPAHVDPATGEIDYERVTTTPAPILIYEYPLPRHFQFSPSKLGTVFDEGRSSFLTRLPIIVVEGASLAGLLTALSPVAKR